MLLRKCCERFQIVFSGRNTSLNYHHHSLRLYKYFRIKTATNLESFVLVAYPVQVMLLNVAKEYKKIVIQSRHIPEALLPDETVASEGTREADIMGPRQPVYCYSSSRVLDTGESI